MEIGNWADQLIFSLFRIYVKLVMVNNLQFILNFLFKSFLILFNFSSFTVTAISCEV
jgi:hypothetical protein